MSLAPDTTGVAGRVASLPDLPFAELKRLWEKLFDFSIPTTNRAYMERRLAYRLQEIEFAKTNPDLLARNKARIDALIERTKPRPKAGRGELVRLVPGTVLTREFNGKDHCVVAMPDGNFEYDGKPYRSLTAVAFVISGTRWSGPAFFGLRTSKNRS